MGEMLPAAEKLFSSRPKELVDAFGAVYTLLVDELGCEARVKTIYVGFTRADHMIAAVHPSQRDPEQFEVALPAIASEMGPGVYDAPHLKWPMLPVAIAVTGSCESVRAALDLLRAAAGPPG